MNNMDEFIATMILIGFLAVIAMFLFFAVTTIISIYSYNFYLGNDVVILFVLLIGLVIILYGSLLNQEDSRVKI